MQRASIYPVERDTRQSPCIGQLFSQDLALRRSEHERNSRHRHSARVVNDHGNELSGAGVVGRSVIQDRGPIPPNRTEVTSRRFTGYCEQESGRYEMETNNLGSVA